MLIGYTRPLSKKTDPENLKRKLLSKNVEELFLDSYSKKDVISNEMSEFNRMMEYCDRGDTVLIPSFKVISRQYTTLYSFIERLQEKNMSLEVLDLPTHTNDEWLALLDAVIQNENYFQPKLNITKISKEKDADRMKYRMFSKDPEAKQTYRRIITLLLSNYSLRAIAQETGVSKSTVFRIKKGLTKAKETLWYIAVFFVTIVCLKVAQNYSANFFIQLLICAVTVICIIWLSYSDAKKDD